MIAPLSGLELALLQILVDGRHDLDTLSRLRDILVAMAAADEVSDTLVDELADRLTQRYAHDPVLSAMHAETCALLAATKRLRAPVTSAV